MKKFILVLAAAAGLVAHADRLNLKSGSYLTGKVLGREGDVVKFESDDLGAIEVKNENIVEVQLEAAQKTCKPEEVAEIEKPPETWHGSVNVAFNSSRGNTYKNGITVLANVNRRWEDDRVNANFGYYYDESGTSHRDKKQSTKRWELEGQWDHFWTKRLYDYIAGRYEQDDIAGIDYRMRLGGGLGLQWLEGQEALNLGKFSFAQEIGAAWVETEYENPDPDTDKDAFSGRYAHHFKYFPKWNEGVELFHNLEFMPQFNDFALFLAKADVGITTKILLDIDVLAKIEWEFDSNPSDDREKLDTRYIVGLGYKW